MNILITGGAGYIGYSLIHKILEDHPKSKITVYDNLSRKNYALFLNGGFDKSRISFVEGEMLDSRKLKRTLKNKDLVIHLAAKVITPFADFDAHSFEQVNHWGTAELAMAIEDSDVKKVIYLSSLSVYGTHDEPINLNTELSPRSFYGISKLKGEEHFNRLKDKKEICIIRSGNVYGFNPSIRLDAVINRFMFEANYTGRISIHGSGEQHRAFIHVDKLAQIISSILNGKMASGINNLAEHNFSVNEIVNFLKQIYPDLEYIFVNQNIRMRDILIDNSERKLLNLLKERKDFLEELKDFKSSFSF